MHYADLDSEQEVLNCYGNLNIKLVCVKIPSYSEQIITQHIRVILLYSHNVFSAQIRSRNFTQTSVKNK